MTTFELREAKEGLMTLHSIRLAAISILLLALGSSVSLASSGPAIVAAGNPALAAFCPTGLNVANRRATRPLTSYRVAECRCSKWDENKHCIAQSCD
jgi:hypothetical protein